RLDRLFIQMDLPLPRVRPNASDDGVMFSAIVHLKNLYAVQRARRFVVRGKWRMQRGNNRRSAITDCPDFYRDKSHQERDASALAYAMSKIVITQNDFVLPRPKPDTAPRSGF